MEPHNDEAGNERPNFIMNRPPYRAVADVREF
jgi:hypothetical protein